MTHDSTVTSTPECGYVPKVPFSFNAYLVFHSISAIFHSDIKATELEAVLFTDTLKVLHTGQEQKDSYLHILFSCLIFLDQH